MHTQVHINRHLPWQGGGWCMWNPERYTGVTNQEKTALQQPGRVRGEPGRTQPAAAEGEMLFSPQASEWSSTPFQMGLYQYRAENTSTLSEHLNSAAFQHSRMKGARVYQNAEVIPELGGKASLQCRKVSGAESSTSVSKMQSEFLVALYKKCDLAWNNQYGNR